MTDLQAMLHETHPYVLLYRQAFHIIIEKPPDEQQNVFVRLRAERHQDIWCYNLPTANEEIAALFQVMVLKHDLIIETLFFD